MIALAAVVSFSLSVPSAPVRPLACSGPLVAGHAALPAPRAGSAAWDGRRRVVHEWGTFTAVLGSDGVALDGLLHEDGSLPPFVLDAADAFALTAASPKMETPVVYLYAPDAWHVRVRAEFPRGAVTQWYPPASSANGRAFDWGALADGAPEAAERPPLPLRGGSIEWGRAAELCALAPGAAVELPPVAEDDPWRFAREVAANALEVRALDRVDGELVERRARERFLFYRGLGDFELPVVASVAGLSLEDGVARLRATLGARVRGEPLASPFVVVVEGERAAFAELADLTADPRQLDLALPLRPRAQVEAELVERVAAALARTGLYADEALAMAHTWRHAWFGDPGLRLVAVLPRALVDRELPLEVAPVTMLTRAGVQEGPGADEVVRTFVARVELLAPERERALRDTLDRARAGDATARAAVRSWGRFAPPFTARAAALATATAGR